MSLPIVGQSFKVEYDKQKIEVTIRKRENGKEGDLEGVFTLPNGVKRSISILRTDAGTTVNFTEKVKGSRKLLENTIKSCLDAVKNDGTSYFATANKTHTLGAKEVPKAGKASQQKTAGTQTRKVNPGIPAKSGRAEFEKRIRTVAKIFTFPFFAAKKLADGIAKVFHLVNQLNASIKGPLTDMSDVPLTGKLAISGLSLAAITLFIPYIGLRIAALPYYGARWACNKIATLKDNHSVAPIQTKPKKQVTEQQAAAAAAKSKTNKKTQQVSQGQLPAPAAKPEQNAKPAQNQPPMDGVTPGKPEDLPVESLLPAGHEETPGNPAAAEGGKKEPASADTLEASSRAEKAASAEPAEASAIPAKVTDKHAVTPTLGKRIKKTAQKVGIVAAAVLTSPLWLPAALAIKAGAAIREKIISIKGDSLLTASRKMKENEETSRFKCLQKSLGEVKGELQIKGVDGLKGGIQIDLGEIETKQKKAERIICRLQAQTDLAMNKEKKEIIQKACARLPERAFFDEDNFKEEIAKITELKRFANAPGFDEAVQQLFNELIITKASKKDEMIDDDLNKLQSLFKLLEKAPENPEDYAAKNQEITKKLREFLASPTYQALKENPNNEAIKIVHRMCCALWNEVQVLDSYKEFGAATLQNVTVDEKNHVLGDRLSSLLVESHKKAAKQLYSDHGLPGKLIYAAAHPQQALASMASEGGFLRTIAEAFGSGGYDSHKKLSNNPSLQGTTEITLVEGGKEVKAKINNCYGGSPTVGDEISPEFDAVCQAAENKQFQSPGQKDPKVPDMVQYTNFQQIENKGGEGARSRAIMRQNRRYPLSFCGITLAKDSELYLMKKTPKKDAQWEDAEKFKKEMQEALFAKVCFECEDRMGSHVKPGFYFNRNPAYWVPLINGVLDQVEEHFKNSEPCQGEEAFKLRAAFQQFTYTLIQGIVELQMASEAATYSGNEKPLIMALRACKENIDRGGMENVSYLAMRLSTESNDLSPKERADIIVGAFQSRAISARDRVILEKRMPQVLAFIEKVQPQDYMKALKTIIDTKPGTSVEYSRTLNEAKFTPAVTREREEVEEEVPLVRKKRVRRASV